MACLRKIKTKTGSVYHIDYSYKGRRYVMSTKTSDLKIAQAILHDIQGKIARGTFNLLEYKQKDCSFSNFRNEYFQYAEGVKSERTVSLQKIHAEKFLKFAGDINLRSVDSRLLDRWQGYTLQHVKPVTFNTERRTLHAMFNVAKKWRYIDENPFSGLRNLKVQERRRFLMDDELDLLFKSIRTEAINSRNAHHRAIHKMFGLYVELLLHTGMRREEGLRLRWMDIDFKKNLLYVIKSKSKQTRMIPLSSRAKEILLELGEALFTGFTPNLVTHKFIYFCEKAGLVGFKLHSIRHTFATKLIDAGVDVLTVSKLLGHADIKTTMIYAKVQRPVLEGAIRTLELAMQLTNQKLLPAKSV